MKKFSTITAAALIGIASPVFAANINILWYTGGAEASGGPGSYIAGINSLEVKAENPVFNISGTVNTWSITYWTGGSKPVGNFNVLVAASDEGSWTTVPSYTALTSQVTQASFGDRVMLTGQDADWHLLNTPGSANFNNPAGFLIDAVNWAGSGTGMGGVFLSTGVEATIFSGVSRSTELNNAIVIPPAYASHPINLGLTSSGLSGWNSSSHESFAGSDPTKWTTVNVSGGGAPVTIIRGGTQVPDTGSTLAMLLLSVMSFGVIRHFVRGERAALS